MEFVSALTEEAPQSSLVPSTTQGHSKNQEAGPHQAPDLLVL